MAPSSSQLRLARKKIYLRNLVDNLKYLNSLCPKAKVFPVVKSNAYGHGMAMVAKYIEYKGADGFCVAFAGEGFELRKTGILKPILVMGRTEDWNIHESIKAGLTPTVHSIHEAEKFNLAARKLKLTLPVHIKFDTGMSRMGFGEEELKNFFLRIKKFSCLDFQGFYTHLACSDNPSDPMNTRQIKLFKQKIELALSFGINFEVLHCLNSGGILHFPENAFDLVRPGISFYGYHPAGIPSEGLMPSLEIVSRPSLIKKITAGASVSYGASEQIKNDSRILVVPIGYGCGIPRLLSNGVGRAIVGEEAKPIIGRVCMDQFMVECPDDFDLEKDVVVISSHPKSLCSVDSIAKATGTINYEILTGLSTRLVEEYIE